MGNIDDYLKIYKDFSFFEEKFNDVDNVIFSLLAYINFSNFDSFGKTFSSLWTSFLERGLNNQKDNLVGVAKKGVKLLRMMSDSLRYRDVVIEDYECQLTDNMQFGVLTLRLPDNSLYIAFQGTDTSLVGWEEDFRMSYMFPVPSQQRAIDYVNTFVKRTDTVIRVGGHSKGGNLALVASMFCYKWIQDNIVAVYSNDGNGLRQEELHSKELTYILPKYKHIIPDDCLVGLLLYHPEQHFVISSNVVGGIKQHNMNTWQCFGGHFVPSVLSDASIKINKLLDSWLARYDNYKKEKIVETLFSILRENGINDLKDFNHVKLSNVVKSFKESRSLDEATKDSIFTVFKQFLPPQEKVDES